MHPRNGGWVEKRTKFSREWFSDTKDETISWSSENQQHERGEASTNKNVDESFKNDGFDRQENIHYKFKMESLLQKPSIYMIMSECTDGLCLNGGKCIEDHRGAR